MPLNAVECRLLKTLPIAATDMLRVLDAACVDRIEAIRAMAETRCDGALAQAEVRAAGLECEADRGPFEAVERGLEAGRATVWREAEAQLQHVVAGGGEAFRETFAGWRGLLGPAWPFGAEAAAALASQPASARPPSEGKAHRRAEVVAP